MEVKPSPAPSYSSATVGSSVSPATPSVAATCSGFSSSPASSSSSYSPISGVTTSASSLALSVSPDIIKPLLAISEDLSNTGEESNIDMMEKENLSTGFTGFVGNLTARKLNREDDDDQNNGTGDEMNKKYRKDSNNSMDDSPQKSLLKVDVYNHFIKPSKKTLFD